MSRYFLYFYTVAVLTAAPIVAGAAPSMGTDGIVRYPLNGRATPELACAPLFVCDLTLEPGETIVNLAAGDTVRWVISPTSSGQDGAQTAHVLVKPLKAGLRTNLVVMTNRRTYDVLLVSRYGAPALRVGFIYAQNTQRTNDAHGPQADSSFVRTTSTNENVDTSYRMSGDPALRPQRVWNDGSRTIVQMPTGMHEIPVVFAVDADGSDTIVNYRFRDGAYVVDGVPERLALVDGSGKHMRRMLILHGVTP